MPSSYPTIKTLDESTTFPSTIPQGVRRYVHLKNIHLALSCLERSGKIDTNELSAIIGSHLRQYLQKTLPHDYLVEEVGMDVVIDMEPVRFLAESSRPVNVQVHGSGFAFFAGVFVPSTDYLNGVVAHAFKGEGNDRFVERLRNAIDPTLRSTISVKSVSQDEILPSSIITEEYIPHGSDGASNEKYIWIGLISAGVALAALFLAPRAKLRKGANVSR